jgi:cupin fold WbuC family metalloprotein
MAGMTSRALPPPSGPVSLLTTELLDRAVEASRRSSRRRVILPLHPSHADPLHRMLNACQPGTYIQPHRHCAPPKAESIVVLRGAIGLVLFDEAGRITGAHVLRAGSDQFGIDLHPGVYHTFVVLEPDTVLFEVKPGPYQEATDKDFATWAPIEGSVEAKQFLGVLASRFTIRSRPGRTG